MMKNDGKTSDIAKIAPVAKKKPDFTDEQKKAINTDGKVLVSASAGSGKTTTMVEKILRSIEGEVPLGKMLILVYNEAAAQGVPHPLRALLHRSGALRHLGARSHRLYAQGMVRPLAGSAPRLPIHALGRGRGRGQSRRNRRVIRGNRREEELFRHLQAQVSHFAECRLCPFGGRGHLRGRLRRNGQPQRGQVGGSPQRLSHLPRLVEHKILWLLGSMAGEIAFIQKLPRKLQKSLAFFRQRC